MLGLADPALSQEKGALEFQDQEMLSEEAEEQHKVISDTVRHYRRRCRYPMITIACAQATFEREIQKAKEATRKAALQGLEVSRRVLGTVSTVPNSGITPLPDSTVSELPDYTLSELPLSLNVGRPTSGGRKIP